MKICIFGVARSGTSALYNILQKILIDNFGAAVDFVYEPFLWNRDEFNTEYASYGPKFNRLDSLSYEGMLAHQRLPLFIPDPHNYLQNSFLNQIFVNDKGKNHLLLKETRINGRINLVKEINDDLKFIYITRNPLDVVHSVVNRFSFFGGEYHKDDYDRFVNEVESVYGESIQSPENNKEIIRELHYWDYMNRFVLEQIELNKIKPLVIFHEKFALNPERIIQSICDHAKIPYKSNYDDFAKERVTVSMEDRVISIEEKDIFLPYLKKYKKILESYVDDIDFSIEKILDKYRVSDESIDRKKWYYGLVARKIVYDNKQLQKQIIKEKSGTIEQLKDRIVKQQERLDKQQKRIDSKDEQIASKNAKVEEQNLAIGKLKDDIKKNQEAITQKKESIAILEKKMTELEEVLKTKDAEIDLKIGEINDYKIKKENLEQEIEEITDHNNTLNREIDQKAEYIKKLERDFLMKEKEAKVWNSRFNEIQNSYSYKVGRVLLYPFRIFKKGKK